MTTISEDYVSFEVAKLLKERGFNADIDIWYDKDGNIFFCYKYEISHNWRVRAQQEVYQCPTLQMAMKYLRKKYKLCIVSIPVVTDDDGDGGCLWNYVISRKLKPLYESESLYESPETALNDAIKYCLENLI